MQMFNYDLCLNWIWDKEQFPEYRRILKDYGLGKLVAIWPPYREQFLAFFEWSPVYISKRDSRKAGTFTGFSSISNGFCTRK